MLPAAAGCASSPRRGSSRCCWCWKSCVFSVIGTNFASLANAFEVLRLCVEIGLLALALTPVITSGGIDLSVGSLMGLSAVFFGKLWRDGGLPIGAAAAVTLGLGAARRLMNGLLITRGRIPPLIVTLGSFSLFTRAGRRHDRRRRQLHRLPRSLSLSGPGLSASVEFPRRCRFSSRGRGGVLAAACIG